MALQNSKEWHCKVAHVTFATIVTFHCEVKSSSERGFFIDNLLVRVHFIIEMIRWNGLAPWEFEVPFPGSLTSTFLAAVIPNQFRELTFGAVNKVDNLISKQS